MTVSSYPRNTYTPYITPIEPLEKLSKHLGGPNIYVKRDDMLGLAAGGNKTRKLEYLMADAMAKGADTLITCGALQSNHCRLTLAAAAKEGLACHLVLLELPKQYDSHANGNNFLFHLMGATVHVVPQGGDYAGKMQQVADTLAAQGKRPYIIPLAGSNDLGTLGYVRCAEELISQLGDAQLAVDHIVVASGSGGSQAGLLAGLSGLGRDIPVTGISVLRDIPMQHGIIYELANQVCHNLNYPAIAADDVILFDFIGSGYAKPSAEMVDAVTLVARCEGILLDPSYTGKAMAGLISLMQDGYFDTCENILFLHTGGSPGLYAYTDAFSF